VRGWAKIVNPFLFLSLSLLLRRTYTPRLAHSAMLGAKDFFCHK